MPFGDPCRGRENASSRKYIVALAASQRSVSATGSRNTGYTWLGLWTKSGPPGLEDRSVGRRVVRGDGAGRCGVDSRGSTQVRGLRTEEDPLVSADASAELALPSRQTMHHPGASRPGAEATAEGAALAPGST